MFYPHRWNLGKSFALIHFSIYNLPKLHTKSWNQILTLETTMSFGSHFWGKESITTEAIQRSVSWATLTTKTPMFSMRVTIRATIRCGFIAFFTIYYPFQKTRCVRFSFYFLITSFTLHNFIPLFLLKPLDLSQTKPTDCASLPCA